MILQVTKNAAVKATELVIRQWAVSGDGISNPIIRFKTLRFRI